MSRNDAQDFATRLYSRVPSQYRVLDEEQGLPLRALLQVIGEQAADLRQDLDDLWDNFFIEICEDWVVPYIGALAGTNLLAHPVGQSNRLDVRNTVLWRRSKGTPRMLEALAQAITGWPADLVEFFQTLGWSQNVNHLRPGRPFTAEIRDPFALSLLGGAADPLAHHADFKTAGTLDQSQAAYPNLGAGRAAWGTPGRYQIRNLGIFLRRLQTFAIRGASPVASPPGIVSGPSPASFTFDPLFGQAPLFVEKSGQPLTRAAFNQTPWQYFGTDVAVRQFGVLLANNAAPVPDLSSSTVPFSFNGAVAGLALDPSSGLRLVEPGSFRLSGGINFIITAEWRRGASSTVLGALSTYYASRGLSPQFDPRLASPGPGQLVLTVQLGRAGLGWVGPPPLPASPPARFPGAVVAVRRKSAGVPRSADALYTYLPPFFLTPGDARTLFVADDGSTYTDTAFRSSTLARPSDGQIYPPRPDNPSTAFADDFTSLKRRAGGLRLPDPARFGTARAVVTVNLFTGAFQPLGAIATIAQPGSAYPDLDAPATWPAFTYAPSKNAVAGNMPDQGLLAVNVKPLSGDFVPAFELVITNRSGDALLAYIAESAGVGSAGKDYFIADDGSTYDPPADRTSIASLKSYSGLALARGAAGQILTIPGVFPLQVRRPVALDLCRPERRALLDPGELGVDPERGRFAFAVGDPSIGLGELTADYVEAFGDRVGARTYDRSLDPKTPATLFVTASGDVASPLASRLTGAPVFTTVTDALAAARDGDVIEIADSLTYTRETEIAFNRPGVRRLTLRAAAGQRPVLTSYAAGGIPASSTLRFASALDSLELNGLLISGGPLRLDRPVKQFALIASTLDPRSALAATSLIAIDDDLNTRAQLLFCRSIAGAIKLGNGIDRITIADSIIDASGSLAIGGLARLTSPPDLNSAESAGTVQLERATVLGRIRCDVLNASECLLDDVVTVEDQQAGCIRFSRYETGSVLPRRYQCVPTEEAARAASPLYRVLPPLFNSRRFGRPDYVQPAAGCPTEILIASEDSSEIGAFASAQNTTRIQNVRIKIREFLPAGLSAVLIGET